MIKAFEHLLSTAEADPSCSEAQLLMAAQTLPGHSQAPLEESQPLAVGQEELEGRGGRRRWEGPEGWQEAPRYSPTLSDPSAVPS